MAVPLLDVNGRPFCFGQISPLSSIREWADVFARENSGLYPNQWMIVDYNLFEPGAEKLPDYLLTV